MKCAFLGTKIGGPFETAKRILLKDVKGFEKVVYRDGDVQVFVAFGFLTFSTKVPLNLPQKCRSICHKNAD